MASERTLRTPTRPRHVLGIALAPLLVAGSVVFLSPAAAPAAVCSSWGAQPPHAGTSDTILYAVDGTSSCDVWAVGDQVSGGTDHTLIERMTPSGWKVHASPNAFGRNYLNGVSAVSPDLAWAVGSHDGTTTDARTLIERWNGKHWGISKSPSVGSGYNSLFAVDATSSTNAWAVGEHYLNPGYGAMILHWNGKAWKVQKSFGTPGGPETFLYGISATSATNAWAVGQANDRSTFIVHWNGKAWKRQPTPNVGALANDLLGVSAVSAKSAWAVGYFTDGTRSYTLVLHWNGKAWKVQASPSPSLSPYADTLGGVAATRAGAWAVGNSTDSNGTYTLILRWTGRRWVRQPSPNTDVTVPYNNTLLAVAAISPSDVWAVGTYGGSPLEPFALHSG